MDPYLFLNSSGLVYNLNLLRLLNADEDVLCETIEESISNIQGNTELSSHSHLTLSTLIELTDEQWAKRPTSCLDDKLKQYCHEITPPGKCNNSAGFIEKHDLSSPSKIAVIGDIHGNDLRFDLTLKALQKRGFLDNQFHCLPDKHIVFLGDYADRGKNTLKVLEMIATFKLENKDQVYLIRGNHEDLNTSKDSFEQYASKDPKYLEYTRHACHLESLSNFYNSLPVAVFLAQKTGETVRKEYIKFCHGLFHLYTDPTPLLDLESDHASLWVSGSNSFSERVLKIRTSKLNITDPPRVLKQITALRKLSELEEMMKIKFDDIYWLDVGKKFKKVLVSGRTQIDPETTKAYLRVNSTHKNKLCQIYRGHQCNGIWSVKEEKNKVIVTTVDPSAMETEQMFVELESSDKVKNWKRECLKFPLSNDHALALQSIETIVQIKYLQNTSV